MVDWVLGSESMKLWILFPAPYKLTVVGRGRQENYKFKVILWNMKSLKPAYTRLCL